MKKTFQLVGITCFFVMSLSAETIKSNISEVLNTNPVVLEKLKNYRATQQDLEIAESEYYPKLDFRLSRGYTDAGQLKDYNQDETWEHTVVDEEYEHYEGSLILTQNIFNGFATMNKVDYQEARILAAAYKYLEVSNDMAFQTTGAYINVLKAYDLVLTARENLEINQKTYEKVQDLFDSGLTAESEVVKIQSSLSLAKSNLIAELNNAREVEYAYKRLVGRMPQIKLMTKPALDITMPESIERAAIYAIENNPSLLVSKYNIEGAQALKKYQKNTYYPKLDLEITQNYNDVTERNSFNSPDDRFIAKIILSYNFYTGGADRANIQKHISKIHQEIELKRDLKRQVIEGLELSWTSYEMLSERLKDLYEYKEFSEKTLQLYKDEYDLGRRTLLDLLSAQNDLINSKNQIINAEYDFLLSKFRVLDAMGLLVVTVLGDNKEIAQKVNLYSTNEAHQILDELPVKFDVDGDKINDDVDICDNSIKANNIMPYGCKKISRDSDNDGVMDHKDQCLMSPINANVDHNGCAIDSDKDGVLDHEDKCPNTKKGDSVDQNGCKVSETLLGELNTLTETNKSAGGAL